MTNASKLTLNQALQWARPRLQGVDSGRLEARVLLQHVVDLNDVAMITQDRELLNANYWQLYQALIQRRIDGEPIAYIVGYREFYSRRFFVNEHVLIPRPETELLVDKALEMLEGIASPRILDLGTGSGNIALTLKLEFPSSQVTALDSSVAALDVAQHNAQTLGADVRFVQSHWFTALAPKRFDLIVSNPPYIQENDEHLDQGDVVFEPLSALVAADRGLADIDHILATAQEYLKPTGWLLVEHGYDQGASSQQLATRAGYQEVATLPDLAGLPRVLCCRLG